MLVRKSRDLLLQLMIITKMLDMMMDPGGAGYKSLTFFAAISSKTQCNKKLRVQKKEHFNNS